MTTTAIPGGMQRPSAKYPEYEVGQFHLSASESSVSTIRWSFIVNGKTKST